MPCFGDGPERAADLASLLEVEKLMADRVDLATRDSPQERISALRNAAEGWIVRREAGP